MTSRGAEAKSMLILSSPCIREPQGKATKAKRQAGGDMAMSHARQNEEGAWHCTFMAIAIRAVQPATFSNVFRYVGGQAIVPLLVCTSQGSKAMSRKSCQGS